MAYLSWIRIWFVSRPTDPVVIRIRLLLNKSGSTNLDPHHWFSQWRSLEILKSKKRQHKNVSDKKNYLLWFLHGKDLIFFMLHLPVYIYVTSRTTMICEHAEEFNMALYYIVGFSAIALPSWIFARKRAKKRENPPLSIVNFTHLDQIPSRNWNYHYDPQYLLMDLL